MLGVSITDQRSLDLLSPQIGHRQFLSIEPLLGPVHLTEKYRWIIVGAETGNRKGRVVPKFTWLMEIRDFALFNSIPLFFKESLRPLWTKDGVFPQEYPEAKP
jgi:protein gp37